MQTGLPDQYFTNAAAAGLVDTAGADMLATMQYNTRTATPTRTLMPCVIGCNTVLNQELRGELEGVFFFGGVVADDTLITRSGATYIVLDGIAVGPVA
jgi:hypothetical protein